VTASVVIFADINHLFNGNIYYTIVKRLLSYRILFLQETALPLLNFTVTFDLDREYSGREIGHFRAFALSTLRRQARAF